MQGFDISQNLGRGAGIIPFEQQAGDDQVIRQVCVAIGEMGFRLSALAARTAIDDAATIAPDALQADENVPQFLAIAAGIGPRGTA